MEIADRIRLISESLPPQVKLVAVSKTHPHQAIREAYLAGHRFFGENKVQELTAKQEQLPSDIEWHMIGHLQTNKVKFIVPFVGMIHSVDSLKLLQAIDKEAEKCDRTVNCLLQVHIAQEETKYGFDSCDVLQLVDSEEIVMLKHVCIRGLMGMASFTDNQTRIRKEFEGLRRLFDQLKTGRFANIPEFCELSMGMSEDFRIAIECGSTMIRLGSVIFGQREYNQH